MDRFIYVCLELLFYCGLAGLILFLLRNKKKAVKRMVLVICGGVFLVLFVVHSWLIFDFLGELKKVQKEIQELGFPVSIEEAVLESKSHNFKPEENAAIFFKKYRNEGWLQEGGDLSGIPGESEPAYKKPEEPRNLSEEAKLQERKIQQAEINKVKIFKDKLLKRGFVLPEDSALLKVFLKSREESLLRFRSLSSYKYTYFNVNLKNPIETVIPDLFKVFKGFEDYSIFIMNEVYERRLASAIKHLEEYHRINEIVNNSNNLLLQSVISISIIDMSLPIIEKMLKTPDLTIAQKNDLLVLLMKTVDNNKKIQVKSLNFERLGMGVYLDWNSSSQVVDLLFSNFSIIAKNIYKVIYSSYTYRPVRIKEKIFFDKLFLDALRKLSAECYAAPELDENDLFKGRPLFLVSGMMIPDFRRTHKYIKELYSNVHKVCLIGRLENYRTIKGFYPNDLNELRRFSGKEIPRNIMECCDFLYTKTATSYEVTSLWEQKKIAEKKQAELNRKKSEERKRKKEEEKKNRSQRTEGSRKSS